LDNTVFRVFRTKRHWLEDVTSTVMSLLPIVPELSMRI
jgi:hypothetical protein